MTRAAGVVGIWTVLSRVLGLFREMITAAFLGADSGADAFFVAFRIPNLLRRLFAEGALSAAFIPTYVDTLHRKGHAEAASLARITFTFVTIVLAVVTGLGVALSPWIVKLTAPGFLDDPSKFELTVTLNRIMFPYIFFVSLVALASGVLNSMGHFSAPAAAPTLLNISMIGAVAVFTGYCGVRPTYALAWGVVGAGVFQLVLQIPFLISLGVKLYPNFNFRHPELRRMGALFCRPHSAARCIRSMCCLGPYSPLFCRRGECPGCITLTGWWSCLSGCSQSPWGQRSYPPCQGRRVAEICEG